MSLPTYVGAGTAASGSGTLTPTIPTSVADDVLLLIVDNTYTTTSAATLSDAQGFVAVSGAAIDSGAYAGIHSYATLFWKRATGSDSAPTVADNGEFNAARIYAFRGCETSGDPWDVVSVDGDNDGDGTMTMSTGATTTGADRLVCVFVTAYTQATSSISGWTNSDLANITERDDGSYTVGSDKIHIALMTGEKSAAGAYGATTATWGAGTYWVSAGITIALKEPAVVAPTLASGTTLAALQAGSGAFKYTVAIEGYRYLLTDATAQQAIDAWYDETATSHYTQALRGLYVSLDNQQQLDWRRPFTRGGSCTLHIAPDESDVFGVDVFKRDFGDQTELKVTIDRDATAIDVRSTTGWDASGEAFIGTECFAYSSVDSDTFTASSRGKYAPFRCDPTGTSSGVGFSGYHRYGTGPLQALLQPLVTNIPRTWKGKWVGVWMHKYDASIPALNSKDNALLVFAGRIESIADDPSTGCTVVELKHVLDCIGDATIAGRDQFTAKIRNTIRLQTGMVFRMKDTQKPTGSSSGSTKTSTNLTVVAGAPADENQVQTGNYTAVELFGKLNAWWAKNKGSSLLFGTYSIGYWLPQDGSVRSYIYWGHGAAATTDVWFELTMPEPIANRLGWVEGGNVTQAAIPSGSTWNGHYRRLKTTPHDGDGNHSEIGNRTLMRYATTVGDNTADLSDVQGTFVDQYVFLPSSFKPNVSLSKLWGIFLVDNRFLAFGYYENGTITNLKPCPEQYGLEGLVVKPNEQGWFETPLTQTSPEHTDIRQVFVLEMPLGDALKRFIKSTGSAGYNDDEWDTLAYGLCLAIPHDLCTNLLTSIDSLPHADKSIVVLADRALRFSTLLEGELILRRAFLRWKNGGIEFATWKSPNAGNSVATLSDANKAAPAGTVDHQKSVSIEDGGWAVPIQTIQYNRSLTASPNGNDGYRDSISLVDRTAVDDLGGDGPSIIINSRGTLGDFAQTGATIGSLAANYLASMPLFSRPAPKMSRAIDQRYFEGLSIGDVVTITDEFARDVSTGTRGVASRYGIVLRHRYSPGGWAPNGLRTEPQGGEVDLFFLGVDRTAAYVPCADVDDTAGNGGYNAGTGALTVYARRYAEAAEAVDASRFVAGDKIRIIERDPSDPAAPLSWDRIIDTVSGNVITPTATLSSPSWDSAKKYRIVFDDYGDAVATQQAKTFQADDADYLVANSRSPFEYAIGGGDASYTAWVAADAVELPPNASYGDGVGRDVGHDVALARLCNNLISYKTARSCPTLAQEIMNQFGALSFGSSTYLCVMCFPVHLSDEILSNDVWRRVSVAPFYRSGDGNNAICRVTLSRTPPTDSDWFDVDRGAVISEISFTTSSTTWGTATADDLVANVKSIRGVAWVYVEVNVKCECYGLATFQEGAILY